MAPVPSAKFMEPEKTRAANSPTLKPAAATHISTAYGQKCELQNKLVRQLVLDWSLDTTEVTSIMENHSHLLHQTLGDINSSFSVRLLHLCCKMESKGYYSISKTVQYQYQSLTCTLVYLLALSY